MERKIISRRSKLSDIQSKMPKRSMPPELAVIRQLQSDVSFLKQRVKTLEAEVNEIDNDVHREINPEFLERLDKIEKQKGVRFNNMKEFDEFMSRE